MQNLCTEAEATNCRFTAGPRRAAWGLRARVWPAPALVSPEATQATVRDGGFWAGGFGSAKVAKALTEPGREPAGGFPGVPPSCP